MKSIRIISLSVFTGCLLLTSSANAQSKAVMNENTEFRIFPNPNQQGMETFVSLQGFKAHDLLVIVYDMFGREIYSKVEVREEEGFLFSLASGGQRLASGVYMITASADDKVFRQKLIVR